MNLCGLSEEVDDDVEAAGAEPPFEGPEELDEPLDEVSPGSAEATAAPNAPPRVSPVVRTETPTTRRNRVEMAVSSLLRDRFERSGIAP